MLTLGHLNLSWDYIYRKLKVYSFNYKYIIIVLIHAGTNVDLYQNDIFSKKLQYSYCVNIILKIKCCLMKRVNNMEGVGIFSTL